MADEWNVNSPIDHTLISALPGETRKLKASAKAQIDREHETPVDGDATGGEHSNGSAVCYEGTITPTNRPDGSTALADNAIDRGRTWLNDNADPANLKRWDGSAFEHVRALGGFDPDAMSGSSDSEGTCTLPNGLILKWGKKTLTGASEADFLVTFATAFPNACFQAYANGGKTNLDSGDYAISTHTLAAASFKIRARIPSRHSPARWFAIGR
jgi:hypothetical protein